MTTNVEQVIEELYERTSCLSSVPTPIITIPRQNGHCKALLETVHWFKRNRQIWRRIVGMGRL